MRRVKSTKIRPARSFKLPENKDAQIVANEHFAPGDVSVSAQIARIKAAEPQAIFVYETGTAVATPLRAIAEGGLDVPVQIPTSNAIYAQLAAYKDFLPAQLYFSTVLALTPGDFPPGLVRDAQQTYFRAFKAISVRPDFANNLAWDPVMIVVAALRHVGPHASAAQIRDYILQLHGYVGINGIYDFGGGDQRGIGDNAAEVARWNAATGTSVRASAARGFLIRAQNRRERIPNATEYRSDYHDPRRQPSETAATRRDGARAHAEQGDRSQRL